MVAKILPAINDLTHFQPHLSHLQSIMLNIIVRLQVLMWCWV